MSEHMKRGGFVPIAFELPFGRGEQGLPALTVRLDDGRELRLAGQIDRVDMAEGADGSAYLRVVDYKTGNNRLQIPDVAAGLQLQLLVYLQVVMDNAAAFTSRPAYPAGVYYSHLQDDVALAESGKDIRPGLKLQGLTVPSYEVVRLSDREVDGWSKLVNVYCSHTGSMRTGLESGQLEDLRQQVIAMLKDSSAALLDGLVAVSPVVDGQRDSCAYCDFAGVCGFERECVGTRRLSDSLPGREAEE